MMRSQLAEALVAALDSACEDCRGTRQYLANAGDLTPQEGGPEPYYLDCQSPLHSPTVASAIFATLPADVRLETE